jgi:hypothetical protein
LAVIEIYPSLPAEVPLAKYSYRLHDITEESAVAIPLQALQKGLDKTFYLTIKSTGGAIDVLGRQEDAFPGGTAYINHEPVAADLAFRMSYIYDIHSFTRDAISWSTQAWLIFPLASLIFLPGWLIYSILNPKNNRDWGAKIGISVGLSLAAIPLILLWTSTLGIRWTSAGLIGAVEVLWVLFLIQMMLKWKHKSRSSPPGKIEIETLAILIAIFLGTFTVRLIMVRDLATPSWVDPVHHATITRLILENGTFPDTYRPLIDLSSASYHAGFHASLAALLALTRMELAPGMLWFGQVLNALTVFAVYLFTQTLVKNRNAAILAALFAGLFTPMPAYYTSWGRYTQLAGLLILPVGLTATTHLLQRVSWLQTLIIHRNWTAAKRRPVVQGWKDVLLSAITLGGLFLVHYRVLAFLGTLILAYLLVHALTRRRVIPMRFVFPYQALALALLSGATILLTLPWWPRLVQELIIPRLNPARLPVPWFSDFSWSTLNAGFGSYILVLAGLGLLWGLWQRQRFPLIILLWLIFLFAIANFGVYLPVLGGMVNNTSVAITLFFPIAALAGYLISWLYDGWKRVIPQRWKPIFSGVVLAVIVVVSFFSGRNLLSILNPATILARQADLTAAEWIQANLPKDAVIAINPFLWGYGLYAGSDGGYWIAPLTGRQTVPQPVLYGLEYRSPASQSIKELSQKMIDQANQPDQLHQTLHQAGITHIYVGARPGVFSARIMSDYPGFRSLYQKDGVNIFQVLPTR